MSVYGFRKDFVNGWREIKEFGAFFGEDNIHRSSNKQLIPTNRQQFQYNNKNVLI